MKRALGIGWVGLLLLAGTAQAAHFGLFVGLNEYNTSYVPSDNWLNYCVPDAGAMQTNLIDQGAGWVASNTTLLVNSAGSKTAIRAVLSNYAAKAVSGDVVVYFHSSHGGNDDITQANVYLCSYNADYTEDELATDLSAFQTGVKVIVIVDACHSGGLFYETATRSLAEKELARQAARNWDIAARVTARMATLRAVRLKTSPRRAAKLIAPEEVGWMTACAYDQYSYESESIAHGWFTYRLLQGFDYGDTTGDGWASFQELFDFAVVRIPYLDQVPKDSNPAILATLAGTAGATPAGDAWDYGDNGIAGATDLALSGSVQTTAVHALRQDLDESDFFAVPVRKGVCYTFRSTNTVGGGDVDVELYAFSEASGANLLRYAYDIDYPAVTEFELVYKAHATGTVYVRVKPYFDSGTNLTYQMAYSVAGTADSMALLNGIPEVIESVAQNGYKDFVFVVPAGQTNLAIAMSGGTGDADLYAARGYIPQSTYDYVSYNAGNNEAIGIVNPPAGEWFIEAYGYEASSNMTLVATCTPGAATIASASNTATAATFALDLTNGAHVSIYSATNLLPAGGHFNWILRSNAATVVDGKVNLNLITNAPGQIIAVGKPLDF